MAVCAALWAVEPNWRLRDCCGMGEILVCGCPGVVGDDVTRGKNSSMWVPASTATGRRLHKIGHGMRWVYASAGRMAR